MHSEISAPSQKEVDNKIDSFLEQVLSGVEAWTQAGALLVELVNECGEGVLSKVERKCPGLNLATLDLFLSIGRRELFPLLAWDESKGAEYLAGLPYDDQERLYKEGVILVERDNDKWNETLTPISQLTAWECKQVFDEHRLRNAREQRAWLLQRERERNHQIELRRKAPKKISSAFIPNRSGYEPDTVAETKFEALKDAQPVDLLKQALEQAHVCLLESRRHLHKIKPASKLDDFITAGLNVIGRIRNAVNEGSI
jgi:hypothetical protein